MITLIVGISTGPSQVFSADSLRLSVEGATLPSTAIEIENASINLTIDLGNDAPLETFVTAHTPAGAALQRTNLGYWVPWSGKLRDLVDNFNSRKDNQINFKILKDEDLSQELFPIRIMVAYKTAIAFKFGVFELLNRPSE